VACASSKTGGVDGDCSNVTAGTDPDGECGTNELCDGAGTCRKKTDGAPCSAGAECESTFCVDDVCCESACTNDCTACAGALTGLADGNCGPVPEGVDPHSDCASNQRCNGAGACMCGWVVPAPGGACPAQCANCDNDTCTIACSQTDQCAGDTINCPPGLDCEVTCTGEQACRGATVNCPADQQCTVRCTCGGGVPLCCQQTQINCGATGTCNLVCGGRADACQQTNLVCGDNECAASCSPQTVNEPTLQCNNSCNCYPC
jgi:hypothetical protein